MHSHRRDLDELRSNSRVVFFVSGFCSSLSKQVVALVSSCEIDAAPEWHYELFLEKLDDQVVRNCELLSSSSTFGKPFHKE